MSSKTRAGAHADLFASARAERVAARAPLADRMRPRTLSEYIGQRHLLAPGKLLRRAIEADRVRSLILYGPPGTGKTTLARVIAAHSNATFRDLNAILSGVKVLREEVQAAQERLERFERQTLLFIDEIHRFNQAQQDALLPWVERGVVTLIGATTENPYFEVNAALNSRSHLFQLQQLSEEELASVASQALHDEERGYGGRNVTLTPEALAHWTRLVNGDARALLNALEVAVETTPEDEQGRVVITLEVAEESIQARAVVYDTSGDAHFDHMSALIKSLRGSDADAALYWLAKMSYAGEPARALFRRLLIFASEDVGLAWPEGVGVVHACAEAFERVGLPEGRFHLAHATLALATAPKSNSTMGLFDALRVVEREPHGEVPTHLKDAHRDGATLGHGQGYLYPHAYAHHWVAQEHLPEALRGRVFYTPSQEGAERALGERHQALREAQLEATLTRRVGPFAMAVSPHERGVEEWTSRAMGGEAARWRALRSRALELLQLERGSVTLDLNPTTGLFTWAALRESPEGGVYCWCFEEQSASLLKAQASPLPWAHQPMIAWGPSEALLTQLTQSPLRFQRVISQRALSAHLNLPQLLGCLERCLERGGRALLLEVAPERPSLFSALTERAEGLSLTTELLKAWREAERQATQEELTLTLSEWLDQEVTRSDLSEAVDLSGAELIKSAERLISTTSLKSGFELTLTLHTETHQQRLTSALLRELLSPSAQSYLSALRRAGLSSPNAEALTQALQALSALPITLTSSWWLMQVTRRGERELA